MEFIPILDSLQGRWQARAAKKPLELLSRSYPGPLTPVNQRFALLDTIKEVRSTFGPELPEEERRLLAYVEDALESSLSGCEA